MKLWKINDWKDLILDHIRGVIQNKLQSAFNSVTTENIKKTVNTKAAQLLFSWYFLTNYLSGIDALLFSGLQSLFSLFVTVNCCSYLAH
jgi:hypothetical protein